MEDSTVSTEFKIPEIQKDTEGVNEILKNVTARAVAELKVSKEEITDIKTSTEDRDIWTNKERYEHLVEIALNGRTDTDGTHIDGWINKDDQGLADLYDRVSFYQDEKDQRLENAQRNEEEQQIKDKKDEAKRVVESITLPDNLDFDSLDTNSIRVLTEVKIVMEAISSELRMSWKDLIQEVGGGGKLISALESIQI